MKKKNLILPLLFFIALPGFSQIPFFQQYYLLRKNEPVQTHTIFQDRSGFIWFGTNKGLFRFDGKNYQQFTVADSLAENQITAIAQDSTGKIWTGHKNGKLSVQNGKTFREFDLAEGSATEAVSDILFDRRGTLWFSTLNDGLYYYRKDRLYRLDELEGMPDLFVYDILEDERGNIWAGTDGGVAICTLYPDSVSVDVLNYADGLPDNIVKKLRSDGKQNVWLATEDAGIIQYNMQTRQFKPLLKEGWKYAGITDFIWKDSQFWISSAFYGFVVYNSRTGITKEYTSKTVYDNLGSITTLLNDREGNIWGGTKTGVIRTPGDILEFIGEPDTDGDHHVMAQAMDKAGDLWISTKEGLFKCRGGKVEGTMIEKPLAGTAFKNFTVISLFVDETGLVWAGLYGEGMIRIDPRSGKIRHFNKELRNGNVLSITGKGNVIWLATLGGAEKISVNGEKLTFTNFNSQNGLSSDFIYQVFIDSKDRVWFATDGKGVDVLDKTGFHPAKGLAGKVVYGLAEDFTQTIWANIQNEGIYLFSDDKFITALTFDKLRFRDNNIQALSADKNGNMIMMHDLGIDIYDPRTKTWRYLGDEAGIQSRRANLNSVAIDSRGDLLVGTDAGIIRCSVPEEPVQANPLVFIEGVRINGKRIDAEQNLNLSYTDNNLIINFLAFWYENPESVNFLYKMDNYDADWIRTGDNTATYSQLPPGEYTFRLRSTRAVALISENEKVLRFTIHPPFWQTPLFYAISVVLLLASGYSIIKFRERSLKQDKLELESKVEERTREIQRNTEEIQAQNEEIMAQAEEIKGINENLEMLVHERTSELKKKNQALEEYAFINAHKLRSPVASILGLVNLLKKTPLSEEAKDINSHLQQSADELDEVVRSITKAIERGEK